MPVEAYECTLSATLAGQFVQTVFHVSYNNGASQPPFSAAKDINEQLIAAAEFVEKFTAGLPASYQATSLRVRRVGPTGGPTSITLASDFVQSQGQRGSEISSAQVNPLLILIGTTTPAKTGRIFIPGIDEADIAQMVLDPAIITIYNDLLAYMLTGTTVAGGAVSFGILRRATKVVDLLDAGYVSPLIGTQRRRLHPI